jgi:uncharacterized protein YcfJ
MRKTPAILLATLLVAAPTMFGATQASASCDGRKNTGALIGGIGGALLGNAVSRGDTGTVIGGVGGAVIGHQVAKSGCNTQRRAYSRNYRTSRSGVPAAYASRQPTRIYYDQYGAPIGAVQPVGR